MGLVVENALLISLPATVIPPMLPTTFIFLPPTELLNKNARKRKHEYSYLLYIVDTPRRIMNI
jgi:hypothetical protein